MLTTEQQSGLNRITTKTIPAYVDQVTKARDAYRNGYENTGDDHLAYARYECAAISSNQPLDVKLRQCAWVAAHPQVLCDALLLDFEEWLDRHFSHQWITRYSEKHYNAIGTYRSKYNAIRAGFQWFFVGQFHPTVTAKYQEPNQTPPQDVIDAHRGDWS